MNNIELIIKKINELILESERMGYESSTSSCLLELLDYIDKEIKLK